MTTKASNIIGGLPVALAISALPVLNAGLAAAEPVTLGFATAETGFMVAYDGDGRNMAQLWVEDRNAAGGLLGEQIEITSADTKSDRVEGARAGQTVVDAGADLVVVSCDYDFGSPAAGAAQRANLVSVFLCAEDPKAGVQGVGAYSFTTSMAAHVQGVTMAHWAYQKLGMRRPYVLLDTSTEYNKSVCAGFHWALSQLEGIEIAGEDTFKNDDPTIQSQITRMGSAAVQPDAVILCSYIPGGASALRQIRTAGVEVPILAGSAMDGTYWLEGVPDLRDFYVPVAASVHGDDPRPDILALNDRYKTRFNQLPFTTYGYPIYAFLDQWAKAVEEAGTTDAAKVVPILESLTDDPTLIGPRSYSGELHIQAKAELLILRYADGKAAVVDTYSLAEPVPTEVLFSRN